MGRRAVVLPSGTRGMMEDECEGQSTTYEMCHLSLYWKWDCETASFTVVSCCAKLQRSYGLFIAFPRKYQLRTFVREGEKQQVLRYYSFSHNLMCACAFLWKAFLLKGWDVF